VGFVVDNVVLEQVFSEYFGFPCQFSFHRLLHIHHISSGAGTVGQLVADVLSGLQALRVSVKDTPLGKVSPCDIHIISKLIEIEKGLWTLWHSKRISQASSKKPLVHLKHSCKHGFRLSHFPMSWMEGKIITLPKPGMDPKFPQNLRSISVSSTTGRLFEKVILIITQRHIEERGLLNSNQFGFRARHSTTLQCIRLTDHVTLKF
jgi:hypothetical protein